MLAIVNFFFQNIWDLCKQYNNFNLNKDIENNIDRDSLKDLNNSEFTEDSILKISDNEK